MTTLPDLDPNTAGQIAFYNVVEQGGLPEESITWGDVTDNNSIESYDVYDNGLIIEYQSSFSDNLKIRLKTDGWVVALSGPISQPDVTNVEYTPTGYQELVDTDRDNGADNLNQNKLAQAIYDLSSDLNDWNIVDFSWSDIGFYDFDFASDGISQFFFTTETQGTTFRPTLAVNDGTTLNMCAIGGYARAYDEYSGGDVYVYVGENKGIKVCHATGGGDSYDNYHGAKDITTKVDAQDTTEVQVRFGGYGTNDVYAQVIVYWSE